jgi:hypothetical protein
MISKAYEAINGPLGAQGTAPASQRMGDRLMGCGGYPGRGVHPAKTTGR